MLRRVTLSTTLGLLIFAASPLAHAGGAALPPAGAPFHAIEQRVAVALGPERTTLWTSLRFEGSAGPLGVVIPVPPGAALDKSSDAWFEALELATAPRVFPPEGVSAACPGEASPVSPFDVAGYEEHVEGLPPEEVVVLDDAAAVSFWADVHGLAIAPDVASTLGGMSGKRFLAARFHAPGTTAVTKTLRVALPTAEATLPLALVRPTSKDLLVTTWVMGPGAPSLTGGTYVAVPAPAIVWNAKTGESNYADARADALSAAGSGSVTIECAGHKPLSNNVPIDDGTSVIDGVITTFFERAAGYGDGSLGTSSCIAQAASALASMTPVGKSCPRADLGVVDGSDTCVEQAGGYTDPAALRCGDGADDLAVALSGLVPADVWLTRQSMLIKAGTAGADWDVKLVKGTAEIGPVLSATSVDLGECSGPGAGTGAGSGSGSSSSSGSTSGGNNTTSGGPPNGDVNGDVYYGNSDMGCDCSGTAETAEWDDGSSWESDEVEVDSYDDSSDDCSGDSTDSGGDNCSGDTSEPSDDCSDDGTDSYDSGGDDCDSGSDSYGGDDCDSGSDSYGGDDCDSGSSSGGDSCDSGSSGSEVDCSGGGGGEECSVASKGKAGKKRSPKLSVMTLGALALLAPLRRLGTERRRRERGGAKGGAGGFVKRLLSALGRAR